MHDYIQIATINDFVFCPRSVYFHSIYYAFTDETYKSRDQKAGSLAHEASDAGRYSTRARYMQGAEVYSHELRIIGKIDIYDREAHELIERKRTIRRVYAGYRYQLYAQKACLEEMGFPVAKMTLHSLTDNKKYPVTQSVRDFYYFTRTLQRMRSFDLAHSTHLMRSKKCARCIYRELCRSDDAIT